MQSDQDKNQWQQPEPAGSKAPYATPPKETTEPEGDPEQPLPPQNDERAESNESMTQPEDEADFEDSELTAPDSNDEPVHWQAHEYIHHPKGVLWFVVFGIVVVALTTAAIFLMNAITFAILIPVMAIALIIYSYRPPRLLNYTLSHQGLHINDRLYPFSQFKTFGILHDGEEYSIMLIPVKRFQPGVSVYFPEEAGEAIVDMLGTRLPMEELKLDPIDKLIHKLRI